MPPFLFLGKILLNSFIPNRYLSTTFQNCVPFCSDAKFAFFKCVQKKNCQYHILLPYNLNYVSQLVDKSLNPKNQNNSGSCGNRTVKSKMADVVQPLARLPLNHIHYKSPDKTINIPYAFIVLL